MTIKYLDSKRISALAYELNAYTTESAYDTTGVTYGAESPLSTSQIRRGIKILSGSSAIGKIIRKVSTKMRGVSSPTGNLTFKVYRSGSAISTSNTLDVSTLTSSFVLKELLLDTKVTLQADDRVVAEYTDATGSMAVHFLYNNSPSTIASGFNHTSWNGSAWSDITYDLMFAFDSTPASYNDVTAYKPTNVQDNSLFVEKDTARRYWFDANPLLDDDFSSSTGWTTANTGISINTSTEEIDWNANSAVSGVTYYDLGVGIPANKWVLQAEVTVDNFSHNSDGTQQNLFLGLSDSNSNMYTNQEYLGVRIETSSFGDLITTKFVNGTTPFVDQQAFAESLTTTTYYVEIKRTSSTGATMSLYTDNTYTTLIEAENVTFASTLDSLRYIKFGVYEHDNTSNGTLNGTMDNVKFYNGVTTASGGGFWTMEPTFEDDFSSSTGWTTVGSNISITGGAITASSMTTQSENRMYKSLGFTIADNFVMEFEFEETAISHGAHYMLFTLTAGSGNINSATNQDAIQIWVDKGSPTFYLRDKDGTSTGSNTSALTFSESTRYYVTLVNNNRTVTYTVRTGSHTGTVLGTNSITLQSGITGLTHVQSGSLSGNSGTTSYTVDNVKVYNGVTTIN